MFDTQWVDKNWVIRKQQNSRGNNSMENLLIIPLENSVGKTVSQIFASTLIKTNSGKYLVMMSSIFCARTSTYAINETPIGIIMAMCVLHNTHAGLLIFNQ